MKEPKPDTRPFPIQGGMEPGSGWYGASEIPWWLAEEAYAYYVALGHGDQSLERLAERGGFGRKELLLLLRKERWL